MAIVPFIIIAIIVAISFGASQFRNLDLENNDPTSTLEQIMDVLNITVPWKTGEEQEQNDTPPTIQEP